VSDSQTQDVTGDLVNPVEAETTQPLAQSNEDVSKEPSRGSQEYNFREMRKVLEQQQQEIRELKETRYSQNSPNQETEEDSLQGLRKDDFLTVAQAEKLALRKAEELLQQREIDKQEEVERYRHSDYDSVVTSENVQKLIEDDQDLKAALRSAPNPYSTAYKLIKKSSFYTHKEEAEKRKSMEAEKLIKNSTKPQSSNSVQSRPIAEASGFAAMTKAQREELSREMYICSSRR
jgi:hypothetical protein